MATFVVPADPAVPTDTLLGSGSTDLLAAAVAAGGGELRGRPMARQTTYEPGRSLTVRYDATIAGLGSPAVVERQEARRVWRG